jgi:hypothetical protein
MELFFIQKDLASNEVFIGFFWNEPLIGNLIA